MKTVTGAADPAAKKTNFQQGPIPVVAGLVAADTYAANRCKNMKFVLYSRERETESS